MIRLNLLWADPFARRARFSRIWGDGDFLLRAQARAQDPGFIFILESRVSNLDAFDCRTAATRTEVPFAGTRLMISSVPSGPQHYGHRAHKREGENNGSRACARNAARGLEGGGIVVTIIFMWLLCLHCTISQPPSHAKQTGRTSGPKFRQERASLYD
jgi:hypothetical protein